MARLPPAKARIALRVVLQGRRLLPARFRCKGLGLSKAEEHFLADFERAGLASTVVERQVSSDRSVRMVVRLADGQLVETVAMPVGAVCVSSQVGCAVGCRFCASGMQGLARNLSAGEILEQIAHARRELHIDRVVFMGMGEPSHNLENVLAAVVRIRDHAMISPRKQTLSTVGSLRAFERMAAAALRPCLALSLHSTDDRLRAELLPQAPREPVAELVAAAERYGRGMGMPVQFEWALLDGVNDGKQEAARLAALLQGVRGYVNVIPYNPVAGAPFRRPPRMRAVQFVRALKERGVLATVRWSTAGDVDGACGQLRRRSLAALSR